MSELQEVIARARKAWAENTVRFVCRGRQVTCAPQAKCDYCGRRASEHEFQLSLEVDNAAAE